MTSDTTPQPNGKSRRDDPFAPFNPEDHGFPPSPTRAQSMARHREHLALCEKYPGRYVAFIDTGTGDELHREVLFTAKGCEEFHQLLGALDPETLRRVETTHVRDPEEGVFCPSITLEDPDHPPR